MDMLFKYTREPALELWLSQTHRVRDQFSDNFSGSFECRWQTGFGTPNPNNDTHYSIFCSLGDFNTNITDLLTDERFDALKFDPANGEVLFRYYSRIFLIASEILTDFQDMLLVFRHSDINVRGTKEENNTSRHELSPSSNPTGMQNIFDFINTVFKHKTRNIHSCNHHMKYYFEDSGDVMPTTATITVQNVTNILKGLKEGRITQPPENVVIPRLVQLLDLVIHGYQVIDQIFQADPTKFQAFCDIYAGKSASTRPTTPILDAPEKL